MTIYEKRIKFFIGISIAVLVICLLRLAQMQLFADPSLQAEIDRIKAGRSKQLQTLRGKIVDRHDEILAADMPRFQVHINYQLSCFLDERVMQAKLAAARQPNAKPAPPEVDQEVREKKEDLERILTQCNRFGLTREQVESKIQAVNDEIWNLRSFLCWNREMRDPNLVARYGSVSNVPLSEALAQLEQRWPDPAERNRNIARIVDIPEMKRDLALVELRTEDEVFDAQLAFMEIEDIQILPTGHRYYPYRSAAAQTIGWVGQATQPRDLKVFADDPLARYLQGEVCGREDGVEYICESLLRGRRGELVYDIDRQLVRETETEFGQDVQLTLDIQLQRQIEQRLTDPKVNPDYCTAPMAAALLDVNSGDILALVSLPSYDLNVARYGYDKLLADPNRPIIHRALNRLYPPGSVAKPLILIAGLESGVITPQEPISCPSAPAPRGWPDCLIYRISKTGHDAMWKNNARNATKGSCNCYFSHLADRIDSRALQEWFFRFGFGRELALTCPEASAPGSIPRRLRQAAGEIGSTMMAASTDALSVDQFPRLLERDRKMFGIGQGNFRVTPLQVANAFATLARRGRWLPPRLFLGPHPPAAAEPVDLPISPATLQAVYEGISAVVNERGGSAYDAFAGSGLARHGVKIYGKTGSTERPYHAWFAGFAEDRNGAKIALAIVIEGGQRGGGDAAPLAREILKLCVQAGHVGGAKRDM